MNRKERRARGMPRDDDHDPVMTVKRSDVEEIKRQAREQGYRDAAAEAFSMMISLPIKVMYTTRGWRFRRLQQFGKDMIEEYNRFTDSDQTLQQYQQEVFELTGIMFKTDGGDGE